MRPTDRIPITPRRYAMTANANADDVLVPPAARSALSRRRVLAGGVAATAGLAVGLDATPAAADPAGASGHAGARDFVSVHRGSFYLKGKKFRFGGTNCYYLHQ